MTDPQAERLKQIKEREAEIAKRARKYLADRSEIGWSEVKVVGFALSELSAAEKAERERCCKDVCTTCADSRFSAAEKFGNTWGHRCGDNYTPCQAAAIRNRTEG